MHQSLDPFNNRVDGVRRESSFTPTTREDSPRQWGAAEYTHPVSDRMDKLRLENNFFSY